MKSHKTFLDKIAIMLSNGDRVKMTELLFFVLLHLKLTGDITWHWAWVFAPLIAQYGFVLFLMYREEWIVKRMAKEKVERLESAYPESKEETDG